VARPEAKLQRRVGRLYDKLVARVCWLDHVNKVNECAVKKVGRREASAEVAELQVEEGDNAQRAESVLDGLGPVHPLHGALRGSVRDAAVQTHDVDNVGVAAKWARRGWGK
jgi:hypothetical protein